VANGDLNWITKKFIAFANPPEDARPPTTPGPNSSNVPPPNNMGRSALAFYFQLSRDTLGQQPTAPKSTTQMGKVISYFQANNVSTVIRLNRKLYDRRHFTSAGMEHIEMYFPDGTTPTDPILLKFLDICETKPGVIAVHCKAGLGRTGTLMASYLMRKYLFNTSEVIGFMRILRPGMVVGPQQNYLKR
jgi:cell division cycle 14